ncbi:GNAT family N-acetyltransferase [Rahnella sp. C60]|uniref:GNAT family N-acetyltransferase n=1 Tax=Rahnella perminowiae TaxID=2816244 RepID=UPI001C270D3F|nr:GNAT family N-acetyltransferase [Rahnella perminowiae]
MSAQIFETDAAHPHLTRLIAELDAYQYPLYPPESFQGINITELDDGEIMCFMARVDDDWAGCACLFITKHGLAEMKRVYVNPLFRGQGIASLLIAAIEKKLKMLGHYELFLETGVFQEKAITLYEKLGYCRTEAFGDYALCPDPLSVYMMKPVR